VLGLASLRETFGVDLDFHEIDDGALRGPQATAAT